MSLDELIRAVCADPADDAPRLAYADTVAAIDPARAELIRIRLIGSQSCYPTLSGHKNRFALRFLPTAEQPIGDVPFQLACC